MDATVQTTLAAYVGYPKSDILVLRIQASICICISAVAVLNILKLMGYIYTGPCSVRLHAYALQISWLLTDGWMRYYPMPAMTTEQHLQGIVHTDGLERDVIGTCIFNNYISNCRTSQCWSIILHCRRNSRVHKSRPSRKLFMHASVYLGWTFTLRDLLDRVFCENNRVTLNDTIQMYHSVTSSYNSNRFMQPDKTLFHTNVPQLDHRLSVKHYKTLKKLIIFSQEWMVHAALRMDGKNLYQQYGFRMIASLKCHILHSEQYWALMSNCQVKLIVECTRKGKCFIIRLIISGKLLTGWGRLSHQDKAFNPKINSYPFAVLKCIAFPVK